jgi:hypothetical protein
MNLQSVIVVIIYTAFFNWLVTRIPFIKKTDLPVTWIILLFALKIIAGIAYAGFYSQPAYYSTSDTWNFFNASKTETDWLLRDPVGFFKDLVTYGYEKSGNIFTNNNSYWNDLKNNFIIKLLAVCNVFTFKNYFADLVFFNFIFFFGPVALYRVQQKLYQTRKSLAVICIFLIPSFLFWCSGIHKDGIIFTCLGLIIFHFHKHLELRKLNFKSIAVSLLCLVALFALRNFLVFLLLPALLVWFLVDRFPAKAKQITIAIYTICVLLFFLSKKIDPKIDLPNYIIEKQEEFKQLSGNSEIAIPPLENHFLSFIRFIPSAIDIAFFRPHVTEFHNISYIPASVEVILLWSIFIFSIFRKSKQKTKEQTSYIYFCLCFSISFLFVCGYTIPFSGAIVRYRSIILPLVLSTTLFNLNSIRLKLP